MGIAEDIVIILIAGLAAGFLANRLRVPLILGYIVAGVVIGPHTGGVTVSNLHQVELLAEIGVALLLFSIGMELSFRELGEVKIIALVGTPVQVLLTVALGLGIGTLLGLEPVPAVVLGGIMSLSSTMVVFKVLMNRGLTGTLSARVMTGILIVQDIAAIPMMILIPQLGGGGGGLAELGLTALKAAAFVAVVVVAGARVIPFVLGAVARAYSRELFMLTVAAIGLGIGYATYRFGLSFAFGAFVAGLVLNRTDYGHQAMSDIIPLRDVFSLIFFTSIGMLFDPSFFLEHAGIIAALTGMVLAGKFVIFFILSRVFGYYNIIPLAVGLGLCQIGEFSFVLARTGKTSGLLDGDIYPVILSVIVITMFISPFLAMLAAPIYALRRKFFRREPVQTFNYPMEGLAGHVVIAGVGRVGRVVADLLNSLGVGFVVMEQNHAYFEKARDAGFPSVFGDAAQEPVIAAAGISTARVLLVTIPVLSVTRSIVEQARRTNPGITVIARTRDEDEIAGLYGLGVDAVVQPEIEAAIEIIRQMLHNLDFAPGAIQSCADALRYGKLSPLRADEYGKINAIRNAAYLLELRWVPVPVGGAAAGRSIGELGVRSATGASVVGVFRAGEFTPNPTAGYRLMEGDLVAVIGNAEHSRRFERLVAPA